MTDLDDPPTRARRRPPAPEEPGDYRQPPHDLAAEQSVLGGMLLSKDAIADEIRLLNVTRGLPLTRCRGRHEHVVRCSLR